MTHILHTVLIGNVESNPVEIENKDGNFKLAVRKMAKM